MSIGYIDILYSGQISGTTISGTNIIVSTITVSNIISTGSTNNNFISLSASSFSASTIQSSNLAGSGTQMVTVDNAGVFSKQSIPVAGQSTIIRNGLNTYTAGTTADYTVNISALTINTLIASGNSTFTGTLSGGSSFSANTIYSGSTNLYSIFSQIGHTHQFSSILNTAHTHSVSEINNLSSLLDTKLNLSGGTMTGTLSASSIGATTISGGTLYSGSTNLYNIFAGIGSVGGGTSTSVQPGLNTYTGGTSTSPSVNISALTISTLTVSGESVLNAISANTLSAQTIISGSTNISSLFSSISHTHFGGIGFTIDGGTSVITTGFKGSVIVPFNCIIQSWTIVGDSTGSIVIDVWKDIYGNYPPTSGDTIAGTEKITLSNQQKNQDLSLTSWTTSISSGDILSFKVDSVSAVKKIYVMINVIKLN